VIYQQNKGDKNTIILRKIKSNQLKINIQFSAYEKSGITNNCKKALFACYFCKNHQPLNAFQMETNLGNSEELITRDEAMQLLKCKTVTFWRYTQSGKIPHYHVGRRMLFKRSEILEAIRIL
jgi:excisionase family DNA binding protein